MKIDKKFFEELEAASKNAEIAAFNFRVAIDALQNVCEHQWVQSENHGFADDLPYCEICGFTENRKENNNQ